MTIIFHRNFEKQILKLRIGGCRRLQERLKIFLRNPFDIILNNHPLKGKYADYRSINIGGDLRAVYKRIDENECIFTEIGTHGELYS
jgi:addiction module RelE/StbE family toxin